LFSLRILQLLAKEKNKIAFKSDEIVYLILYNNFTLVI
jgi:hypothetical protein